MNMIPWGRPPTVRATAALKLDGFEVFTSESIADPFVRPLQSPTLPATAHNR